MPMADGPDAARATAPSEPAPGGRRRPFRAVAVESVATNLANQLTAAAVVLPFIAVALGGPILAAALIYPVFTLANLAGAVATPSILASGRSSKAMLSVAVAAAAVFTVANAVGSQILGEQMATGFVATAAALGFVAGVSTVCFLDVVAGALAPSEQSRLPVLQSSIAGALVLTVTALDRLAFGDDDGPTAHVRLLWLGAAAMLIGALSCLLIQSAPRATASRMGLVDMLRRGLTLTRQNLWLRRYLLVQTLFLTVSLGSAFYSAHGATIHGATGGSLHLIVAVSSVGLLVFAVAWVPLRPHMGLRGLYWLAAALGLLSASLCILADVFRLASAPWIYGLILGAAAMSALAISTAKQVWLLRNARNDRVVIISFSQLVIGIASALIAAALAALAHVQGAIWPVYVVLLLDLVAMTMIRWAPSMRMTD
jgi:hypothetical protein